MEKFVCNYGCGFCPAVSSNPATIVAVKKVHTFAVEFALQSAVIETHEGQVMANVGDAVVTGVNGEKWPVSLHRFLEKYQPTNGTAAGSNGDYQSLPLKVHALQIDVPVEVTLPDGVSKLNGLTGDWLIDYGDGSLGVVSQEIFEKIYTF